MRERTFVVPALAVITIILVKYWEPLQRAEPPPPSRQCVLAEAALILPRIDLDETMTQAEIDSRMRHIVRKCTLP